MSVRDLIILGCSSQQPTRLRNHGAYLLRWNQEGLLFDPGEGTQRQFIYADVSPTCVTRIFISHFHGDHCLGVSSMLMRFNLDQITHPIHIYYPASGKAYFDRLRYCTIYHNHIEIIEHPISEPGLVHDDGHFRIEAEFLEHGVDNLGWKILEPDERKFDKKKLELAGIRGFQIKQLEMDGTITIGGKKISLEDVSWIRQGNSFVSIIDTKPCDSAYKLAKDATMLLCESTYLDEHRTLAKEHFHMTAKEAALLAKESQVGTLILTHFSARYRDLMPFEEEARTIFPNTFAADDFKRFPFPKI